MNHSTAGIILAAGGSKRFGKPKQLLDWFGKTFIEQTITTASKAKLDPIIVITGAYKEQITSAVKKYAVHMVTNERWEEGQSTSLKAGIEYSLSLRIDKVVFLLCDQPQIPSELIDQIIAISNDSQFDIVTASNNGKVCPPILFKKNCFPELLELSGDRGGRDLVTKYSTHSIEWPNNILTIAGG